MRLPTSSFSWLVQSCMSLGSSVHLPQRRGMTNDTVVTRTLMTITSTTLRFLQWLTFFILQIVRCSFPALKHAPINPPRHPIRMNNRSSHTEKLELPSPMEVNSPNEKSFSTLAWPHLLSWLRSAKSVPSVIMAQKKA